MNYLIAFIIAAVAVGCVLMVKGGMAIVKDTMRADKIYRILKSRKQKILTKRNYEIDKGNTEPAARL